MNASKVFDYIDSVEQDKNDLAMDEEFKNSIRYKQKCLDKEKEKAKKICLAKVFEKFYTSCLPLSDDYKCANSDELCNDPDEFAKKRDCEDMSYYVGEAMRRGSKPACRIMESVDKMVDDAYKDKELNLRDCTNPGELVFRMDDAMEKRIDVLARDLELDDLSQVINDNVKATAISEIRRAKEEKENNKALEKELANDMSIRTESAINDYLAVNRLNDRKVFQPSLFEGIMIGKLNKVSVLYESGYSSPYLYGALDDYGFSTESTEATAEEVAFVESVREYTMLNIAKALYLESFNLPKIRELAQEYAQN